MIDDSGKPDHGKDSNISTQPLEVVPNCWMVGRRNPATLLQCNTYLRVFDEAPSPRRICVDPGSRIDFPFIAANVKALIGDLSEIDAFTLNHQDPDVVGNAPYLCESNRRVTAIVTEDVWRLVQHLSLRPGKVEFANAPRSPWCQMAPKSRWQLVPTPFCHFRGAMAFYDPEIRTLFTGDLFGGLNELGRVHLFAEEQDWEGVAQFHQIYMPTREVLRYAVRQIRALQPAVEVIAPQHGHVIAGDQIPLFLERLHELLVGHDLLALELDESYLAGYQRVISDLVAWAQEGTDPSEVTDRLQRSDADDDLAKLLEVAGNDVRVRSEGYSALVKVFTRLSAGEPEEFVAAMRSHVLGGCTERGLPIPPIGIGLEEGGW